MYTSIKDQLQAELDDIRTAGLFKTERSINSPQSSHITAGQIGQPGATVLNFCANNYLGLADHPDIIAAAKEAMDSRGFGMASVRFICGTQDLHLELEARVSKFLGTEDTILFSSCFDANGGVFESLFGPEDAIISDALNHASIIDGIRLCKAQRFRYANQDMADLEAKLVEAKDARRKIIVTDGVFSMDGYLAPLEAICDLAEKHDALVMVDDSHAVGFMGATGAGTPEHAGVSQRVDIYTGTFGKALGGASGGYVSGRSEVVAMLRQKARPYLFSNSLAPAIVAATIKALDLVENSGDLRTRLFENARLFRRRMTEEGFELLDGEHAIVPVMFGDAVMAAKVADQMLQHGVFVTAFSFPVVRAAPPGSACSFQHRTQRTTSKRACVRSSPAVPL
ncbi:2-amino-3-ketobutyrate coenzyme A ligase [Arthrobacter sp. Hiyo4]|nr:2-amino-3-ketobutyrate coenzyme A ligase [Arthrobacter sp. Hiyo4]